MPILQSGPWRIDYLDEGLRPGAGQAALPTVLLLHSSASSVKQWRALMDTLAADFRVLAVNLFGYGQTSPWPPEGQAQREQTVADHVELIFRVIDHVSKEDGEQTVSLVGHSLGAILALEAARHRPGAIRSLAVFEPNPFHLMRDNGRPDIFERMAGLLDAVKRLFEAGQAQAAAKHFITFWSDEAAWDAMPAARREAFTRAIACTVHEGRALACNPSTLGDYARLTQPTLLMYAAHTNPAILPVQHLLQSACPHWQVAVQPQGGHMAPLTHADAVNPVIADFLLRCGAGV